MIVDDIKNINVYKNLSPDIFEGLKFIKNATPDIAVGTYIINEQTKAIVTEYIIRLRFLRGAMKYINT